MRKFFFGIILGILLTMVTVAFGAEKPIKILLDGREINSEVPPQIINDRTFVPIRVISEALGVNVKWDSAARAVILTSHQNMPVFSVVSYEKIDDEYGYTVLGEVKNESQKTFSKAEIKAEVFDAGGNSIEKLTSTLPPGITPGATAYFKLRTVSGKGNLFNSINFSFTTSDECSVTPTDVVFNNVRLSKDTSYYSDFTYVSGEVERTDKDFTREYKHPMVQIALFDKSGKMINYGETPVGGDTPLDDYKLHRLHDFKITLDKGPAHSSYKLKCFSD